MGREKLPVSINNSEEFCCQEVQKKWSSSWVEMWCQKIFVFIFNERNKRMFLCMAMVLEKGGKFWMQKTGEELLEKYPCSIRMGWNLVHKCGDWPWLGAQ